MPVDLERIEEAARAASPGPWELRGCNEEGHRNHVGLACYSVRTVESGLRCDTANDRTYQALMHPGTALEMVEEIRDLRFTLEWIALNVGKVEWTEIVDAARDVLPSHGRGGGR